MAESPSKFWSEENARELRAYVPGRAGDGHGRHSRHARLAFEYAIPLVLAAASYKTWVKV